MLRTSTVPAHKSFSVFNGMASGRVRVLFLCVGGEYVCKSTKLNGLVCTTQIYFLKSSYSRDTTVEAS